jgi:hypothetical protein
MDDMIRARIEFKHGFGKDFCPGAEQDVIEMCFESVEALISTVKEFEDYITDCTAQVKGKIIDLRSFPLV